MSMYQNRTFINLNLHMRLGDFIRKSGKNASVTEFPQRYS